MHLGRGWLAGLALATSWACGDGEKTAHDAAIPDGGRGVADAGAPDGAEPDGGVADGAPAPDGGADGGAPADAGTPADAADARPPMSDCERLCGTLDACGSGLPAPGCVALCEGLPEDERDRFLACGGALAAGDCGTRAFFECLGRDVDPACGAACAAADACEGGEGCFAGCFAGVRHDDPLARRHATTRAQCLAAMGGDCAAVGACLRGEVAAPDRETFCEAWNGCGLDQAIECDVEYDEVAGRGADGAAGLRCLVEALSGA